MRSAQRLADVVRAGQTGCFRPGTYPGGMTLRRGGGPGSRRIVLRLAPGGGTATIVGQLLVSRGADFVTIAGLRLDGTTKTNRPSPLVNARFTVFRRNDVFSSTDRCFVLGDKHFGVARGTILVRNRIHDCGVPGTNQDHGVYVREAVDVKIDRNVIFDNPDRGIQLFPHATRTLIQHNVIDANGEGVLFSGDETGTSTGNVVTENVITNSRLRWDVESFYRSTAIVGTRNIVRDNCVHGGNLGTIKQPLVGFSTASNIEADPGYADAAARDLRLGPASPCAELLEP